MIIEVAQNSPEWLIHRLGMATACRIADVMKVLKVGPRKGLPSKERENYALELAGERMSHWAEDHYVSPYMEDGKDREPMARLAYAKAFGVQVKPGGFAIHDRLQWFGASPDGLVGEDGLVEIKCPLLKTHNSYRLDGCIPEEYLPQMVAQLACTGRQWNDFVSFHPKALPNQRFFIRRLERDEDAIRAMEAEVEKFLAEVDALVKRLSSDDPADLTPILKESLEAI